MKSVAIFEKVAAGELTPNEAASMMLEADRKAITPIRPKWMPALAWTILGSIVVVLLGMAGFRREG